MCICAQPVNQLSGIANQHSVLAILYSVINLDRMTRMSTSALGVLTLVNDQAAKLATMYEVLNGEPSSAGAQLRRLQYEQTVPDPFSIMPTRGFSVYCTHAAGDFPAIASMLPNKASVSAHRYDRKSTIDQRHPEYGNPVDLSDPHGPFRRVTYQDIADTLAAAAAEQRVTYRADILANAGLREDAFRFEDGGYQYKFALAGIPYLDWLNSNSHDLMHTGLLGHVPLESGLQQFVFIRVRKYYKRHELNQVRAEYARNLPAGSTLPEFGKYVEVGREANKPDLNGRLKFNAAQNRVWLEHGTSIMELLFERNVRPPMHVYAPPARVYMSRPSRPPAFTCPVRPR